MKAERYKLFLELYEEAKEDAYKALMRLHPETWSGIEAVDFNENYVEFRGHETWSYGGSERHYAEIDVSYFLDETGPNLFLIKEAEDKRQLEAKALREQKEKIDKEERKKQQELKKLAELKAKYESDETRN